MQILKGLAAEKLSADLMARFGLAFNQSDTPSLASECNRSGTACHSTTDDQNFVLQSMLLIHWMFHQVEAGFHLSSRRPESSLAGHSVQIVILEAVALRSEDV
jgi:hypothetical protein